MLGAQFTITRAKYDDGKIVIDSKYHVPHAKTEDIHNVVVTMRKEGWDASTYRENWHWI